MTKYTAIAGKIGITFVTLVLFLSTTAAGDIAPPYSLGHTMQPVNITYVQMVNETVQIDMYKENATVQCNFTLMNRGENESLLVGFPIGLGWDAGIVAVYPYTGEWDDPYTYPLNDFRAYVNSQEVETETINVSGSQWQVWNMSFEEMETKNVEVDYWVYLSAYGGMPYHKTTRHWFTYVLETGAAWSGVIDEADITMNLHEIEQSWITTLTPDDYVFENDRVTWNFTSIEPSENIYIEFVTSNPAYQQAHTISGFILDRNGMGIAGAVVELHYGGVSGNIVNDTSDMPLVTTSLNATGGAVGWYDLTNLPDNWEDVDTSYMVVAARLFDGADNETIRVSDPISFDPWFGWHGGLVNVTVDMPSATRGDLNHDDHITPADAAIALQIAATGAQNPAADVSGDERVTSLDALMILQAAAGAIGLR
ncbi:MAG: dockerin type I repeat-containing protein [Euryarchaeota archaeon]|nr:dockerin type I repeat-containing protein [Euryarchaeota archaeon]